MEHWQQPAADLRCRDTRQGSERRRGGGGGAHVLRELLLVRHVVGKAAVDIRGDDRPGVHAFSEEPRRKAKRAVT